MNQILIRPIFTEKSMTEASLGRFTFAVRPEADKTEIGRAVKELFKVDVVKIQTVAIPSRIKRSMRSRKEVEKPAGKKAIVTLKPGQKIEVFDVTEEQTK